MVAHRFSVAVWFVTASALISGCGARSLARPPAPQLEPTRTLAPQPTRPPATVTAQTTSSKTRADAKRTPLPAPTIGADVLGTAESCATVRPDVAVATPRLSAQAGRVMYLTPESDIALSDVSGKVVERVTDDGFIDNAAKRMRIYLFPTAAGDGESLAFVRVEIEGNKITQTVSIAEARDHGATVDVFSTGESNIPYIDWSPNGQSVAFLTINAHSGEIRVADRNGGDAAIIESGNPAYWHWHRDSDRLVTHLGGRGERRGEGAYLSTIGIKGNRRGDAQVFDTLPGAFQSPHYAPDAQHMIYAANFKGNGDDALVLGDATGVPICVLSAVEQGAYFAWSPDGVHVAVLDTPGPAVAPGALRVFDVRDGTSVPVHQAALAFFWSPDGKHLAVYSLSDTNTPTRIGADASAKQARPVAQGGGVPMLRIEIADAAGGPSIPVVDTYMTGDFRQYLQFFDQYSRSVTPWSPNGAHLVFAGGQRTDGPPVIGLATFNPAHTEIVLDQLGEGSLAFFSPK